MRPKLRPAHVYFLIMPGVHILDLGGPAQILSHRALGETNMHYISVTQEQGSAQGVTLSKLEKLPQSLEENAWLVLVGNVQQQGADYQKIEHETINWLKSLSLNSQLLCCICSGALLAGHAGLLDQQACTTHHSLVDRLKEIVPSARVFENRIYVGKDKLWTSAGISTGIDLCLHLVSLYWGNLKAQQIARDLVIYHRRSGEDSQTGVWLNSRSHTNERIHHVQNVILENSSRDWMLDSIAALINISSRQLTRLFRSTTGLGVNEYVQCARIEQAKTLHCIAGLYRTTATPEDSGITWRSHPRRQLASSTED